MTPSPNPLSTSRSIRFIDRYLCRIIHNPVITSTLLMCTIAAIQSNQIYNLYNSTFNSPDFIFVDEYVFDIISNALNILFVFRFQLKSQKQINKTWETLLFIAQNIGCYNLLFSSKYSILFNYEIHSSLKVCLVTQILFPYLILLINLLDWKKLTYANFLHDCNSNLLSIFISHSFLFINYNFPYFDAPEVLSGTIGNFPFIYKISAFSLKFYCIYGFIIYEIALILYETDVAVGNLGSLNCQSEDCYNTDKLQKENNGRRRSPSILTKLYRDWSSSVVVMSSLFVIAIDFVFVCIAP
ncbi:predicted protein [Scheffersomyces stipitis CBS 6054]|uniref:Uncharacterized protein n=1 Tax=Scheffersomyces stipitis (strain ATCC 58785 / CBS 6054 / NBRC 10063 / NRRL Y-11545) TaxID=322104 RepID=A3LPG4_PICST|nr:predicted protein [Scheffersomyces stipitis CBS 6054]ABN64490.2 predicted protein [Scheffersomyces stipitis CBS 6054]